VGVSGVAAGPNSAGVVGFASDTTGTGFVIGVKGLTTSPGGNGVRGVASAPTGVPIGFVNKSTGCNTNPNCLLLQGLSSPDGTTFSTVFKVLGSGTVQASAYQDLAGNPIPGGTITGVSAGAGLAGGGTSGNVSLSIPTSGVTATMLAPNSVTNAAIADGSLNPAKITGTAATLGANNFIGNQTVTGNATASGTITGGQGVFGNPAGFTSVLSAKSDGSTQFGMYALSTSTSAIAIGGDNFATTGTGGVGVQGRAQTANSTGVVGFSSGASSIGVEGFVNNASGVAGMFLNNANGKILSGQSGSGEVFSVAGAGNVTASGNSGSALLNVVQSGAGQAATFSSAGNDVLDISGTGGQNQVHMTGNQTLVYLNSTSPGSPFDEINFLHSGTFKWRLTTNPNLANANQIAFIDSANTPRLTLDPTGTQTIGGHLLVNDPLSLNSDVPLHVIGNNSSQVAAEFEAGQPFLQVNATLTGTRLAGLQFSASNQVPSNSWQLTVDPGGFNADKLDFIDKNGTTRLRLDGDVGVTTVTGNLTVTGSISAGIKDFKIDHPLDPENKVLYHASVESSEMKNIYDGVAVLDKKGQAWVDLPDWFEALNMSFRYQLTAVGAPGPNLYIAKEISGNRFQIAGGKPGAKVSWQVTGVRHDAYANAHPLVVEEQKTDNERSSGLRPGQLEKSELAVAGK
jgi:hypothetical protein